MEKTVFPPGGQTENSLTFNNQDYQEEFNRIYDTETGTGFIQKPDK